MFGSLGNATPFDFVKEIQVKTGGYEAEFGQSTGGVVNVITKSGSNEFRGSVFGYARPSKLEGDWTQVTSPPFLKRFPLDEEMTRGFTAAGISTVGASALVLRADAIATPAAALPIINSRRFIVWLPCFHCCRPVTRVGPAQSTSKANL